MLAHNPELADVVRMERDAARKDKSKVPAFRAWRVHQSLDPAAEMLLNLADWLKVADRDAPPREGRPVVGVDLGESRSWSAAVCWHTNGRVECYAAVAGIPDIAAREKQDGQPKGTYQRLVDNGSLVVDHGRRSCRPEVLIDHLLVVGVEPDYIVADRFLQRRLEDTVGARWPVRFARNQWSESTQAIADFRELLVDHGHAVAPEGVDLMRVSLAAASVKRDAQGSRRIVKRRNGRSRDDVAVAGCLAASEIAAALRNPPRDFVHV